jgi:hypothetical protein
VNELANWDVWGGAEGGLENANVVCLMVTAEEAVTQVVERARQKYRVTEWSRWRFRTVEFGQVGAPRVVHFQVDGSGREVRRGP